MKLFSGSAMKLTWCQIGRISLKKSARTEAGRSCNGVIVRHKTTSAIDDDSTEDRIPSNENPLARVVRLLKNDMINLSKGRVFIPDSEYFPKYCDVLVIGGGVIGSSIAFWLRKKSEKGLKVVVLEKDNTYAKASTTLSVGGIRQQFSLPENIQMSMFGAEFLRDIKKHLSVTDMDPPDVQFQPQGYLILAPESGVDVLKANNEVQRDLGARVDLLTATQLKATFPWLNTDGVALGSYGYGSEGWFDPYMLLMAFKRKAVSLGTFYVNGEAIQFTLKTLKEAKLVDGDHILPFRQIRRVKVKLDNGEEEEIQAAYVIIAAGAHSGHVGRLADIGEGEGMLATPIPVEPRKRYVYVIDCPNGPGIDCPLVIDSSGAYFRRDGLGSTYICGKSPNSDAEPDASNLEVDYQYFDNEVWPRIAKRVPSFENIKVKSAWAGYYDYNTFDQNAIIGPHPLFPNLLMATGFSGHGIQQAPAIGRAIAELIINSKYETINLRRFAFERIVTEEPIYERNII